MTMEEEEIVSIMRRFGWGEPVHMPVANQKNKILQYKLEEGLKKTTEATNKLNILINDLKATRNYSNVVTEQRLQNERMCGDYHLYLEEEKKRIDQLYDEKERISLVTHDANKEKKRFVDLNERLKIRSNELRKKSEDLRKSIVDCAARVELVLHETRHAANETDGEATTQAVPGWDSYLRPEVYPLKGDDGGDDDDDSEFEKMECRRRQLVHHVREYERLLSNKMTETKAAKARLRKIGELARISRDERKCLLDDWRNAARCFKFRLFDIGLVVRNSQIVNQASRNTNAEILQHKEFYEEQIRTNRTVEIEARRKKKTFLTLQQSNEKLEQSLQSSKWLVKNGRRRLALLGNRQREIHTVNALVKQKTNSIEHKIQNIATANALLQRKVANMGNRFASSSDRIERLNDIMRSARKRLNQIVRERRSAESSVRTVQHDIEALKRRSKWMELQFKKLRLVRYRLECMQHDCDDESQKRKDTLYAISRKVEETKARLANFCSHRSSAESKRKLEEEWSFLSYDMRVKRQIMDTVLDEICRCEVFLKDLQKRKALYEIRAKECELQKQQITALKTGGENLLRRVTDENGEKEVVENVLRLRVSELESGVTEIGNYVFSTATRKTDLETALRERLFRGQQCVNVLKIRKKTTREEVSILKRHVERFNARIGQLLKRYKIVTTTVNTGAIDIDADDDDDDDHHHHRNVIVDRFTIADYKIKLLRKRFSLLKRGDELDEKIRKIEKEIQATENTLFLTNAINGTLKQQVIVRHHYDDDDDKILTETRGKVNLQIEYEKLKNLTRKKRRTIPSLNAEIEALKLVTVRYRDRQHELAIAKSAKGMELFRSEKDIDGQKTKLERAKRKLFYEKMSFESFGNVTAILECEFVKKELRRINKITLARINEFVANNGHLQSAANRHLAEKGVILPSAKC